MTELTSSQSNCYLKASVCNHILLDENVLFHFRNNNWARLSLDNLFLVV